MSSASTSSLVRLTLTLTLALTLALALPLTQTLILTLTRPRGCGRALLEARRVVRRASECVRSFIVCERRVEDILRLSGGAAQCRGGRTKLGRQLDVIGAPRSLRENLFRLKGLRNAAAHEVDCEQIAATTDDDLAGLIREIDRDLKALEEESAGARRVTR